MFVSGGRTGLMEEQLASSAGSFLKVAGPRWPQGEHLYPLNCRPQGSELLQGPPGSVETRSKNPQQFLDESETSKASRCVPRKRSFILRCRLCGEGASPSTLCPERRAHLTLDHCWSSALPVIPNTSSGPLFSIVEGEQVGSAPTFTV